MEVILLLLLILVITLLISNHNGLKNRLFDLSHSMTVLYKEINGLKKEIAARDSTPSFAPVLTEQQVPVTTTIIPEKEEPLIPPSLIMETIPAVPVTVEEAAVVPPVIAEDPLPQPVSASAYSRPEPQQMIETPGLWDRWIKNNPDLEKFIGENLINKIGIGILVLGIAFFVKYAIDKEWINEVGRVGIGLLCGALLCGIGHRLRNNYRSFSSVLAGGGIAVFYFTIAFAFHQYHLMSQTMAFLAMVVITVFAILLSLRYNRLELAIIATVGGFLTPFLVSTGSGNYIVLFSYLLILNSGIAVLAYFKRWTSLNIISLGFTQIIFGSWMGKAIYDANNHEHIVFPGANSFGFATAFYLLFLGMNVIHQIRNRQHFKAIDFSIILVLNGSFFAAAIISLDKIPGMHYKGLLPFCLAILQLLLILLFRSREGTDKKLQYLLYGLAVTFATLAVPIQFEGRVITLFWLAEFVLLLWLYLRMEMPVFKYASGIVLALASVNLLSNWVSTDTNNHYALGIIFDNLQGITTNIVAIAAFMAAGFILRRHKDQKPVLIGINTEHLVYALWTIAGILIYLTSVFAVNLIFGLDPSYYRANIYHQIITYIAAYLIQFFAVRKVQEKLRYFSLIAISGLCFLFYIFSLDITSSLLYTFTDHGTQGIHLCMHWAAVVLLLFNIYYAIQKLREEQEIDESLSKVLPWFYSVMLVIILSFECFCLFMLAGKNGDHYLLREQFYKAGLSVVWGLSSFAFMWLGMRHKFKPLRIISLSLFAVVLAKLFLYDIRDISETGKIIAFILLGVLLLLVSFMYQKLKKIIIDDQKTGVAEKREEGS